MSTPSNNLNITIVRPMFSEFFTLILEDGQTEELDPEELRAWFKVRGADMDKLEKVFDHVWNFSRANVTIANPKTPPRSALPHSPDI